MAIRKLNKLLLAQEFGLTEEQTNDLDAACTDYSLHINNIKVLLRNGALPRYLSKEITAHQLATNTVTAETPRQLMLKSMQKYLKNYDVQAIEESCYNAAIAIAKSSDDLICRTWDTRFANIYLTRCQFVIEAINSESETCKKYGVPTIDLKRVGFMDFTQLCPQALVEERKTYEVRAKQEVQQKVSRVFTCWRCKGNKTTYIEKQLRGRDEAPSFIVTCANPECGETSVRN